MTITLDKMDTTFEVMEDLIQRIGYYKLENILLSVVDSDLLVKAYKKDKHLNNILNHKQDLEGTKLNAWSRLVKQDWAWSFIGHDMLFSQSQFRFKTLSLSNLTCLAKAVAKIHCERCLEDLN